jgi:hypothetical protein
MPVGAGPAIESWSVILPRRNRMPTIYPLLKPHDWAHQDLVAHRLISDKVPGIPLVAFGFDAGDNYQFVSGKDVDDIDRLNEEAMGNLAALRYPWELGDSHGLRYAASSGNEFSAEQVLCPSAMLEAHRLLESDRIVASAPRRTCLFATRDGQPDREMSLFVLEQGVIKDAMFPPVDTPTKRWWKLWG